MTFSSADMERTKIFQECVIQLGGMVQPGIAPRSNVERILQMALDDFEDEY